MPFEMLKGPEVELVFVARLHCTVVVVVVDVVVVLDGNGSS